MPFSPIPSQRPHDESAALYEPEGPRVHQTRADCEYGALMQCAPHEEPEWSRDRLLPLRDVIQDAMDAVLDDRERWVFDAITIERRSFRDLQALMTLSKSQVHRVYRGALRKMEEALQDHPMIKEYLTR